MKNYILPFMFIAIFMAIISCSSSDDEVADNGAESNLVPMIFTATQEINVATRVALDNSYNVNWEENDIISVFDGVDNQDFTLTGDVSTGLFSGVASSDATKFTAVYPYTSVAKLESDGSVSGITLTAEQIATQNSFDPAAALMMAMSNESNKYLLDFKNAVSLVKIETEFACKKIVLSANDNIAGTGTLKLTYDEGTSTYISSISFTSGESKSITLKPATGSTVIAPGTYYIVVPPKTLSGFSISFTNSDDSKVYTRTSNKNNTFNRSKIKDFGTFTEDDYPWTSVIESNGIVKASQQVDMGVFNISGNKYRVIFTTSNLTKNGLAPKESDYGDYFAFAATEPWCTSYSRYSNGTVASPVWGNSKGITTYAWSTVPYKDPYEDKCTQYISSGSTLALKDDAAYQKLGGNWQIPTKEIWTELTKTSNFNWTTKDGYNGYMAKSQSNSNNSIFLPAGGIFGDNICHSPSSTGGYWSRSANSDIYAYYFYFNVNNTYVYNNGSRYCGLSIRPVRLVAVPE